MWLKRRRSIKTNSLQLAFTPDRQAFRPAAGNIYRAKCVQIKAFRALTAVRHQVCLHKTRPVLLPVGKGPDGYRVLKQIPRLSGSKSPSASYLTAWPQQPVDRGRTHPAESSLCRSINLLLAMLPEHLDHLRDKGPQTLGAQPVTGFPNVSKRLHYALVHGRPATRRLPAPGWLGRCSNLMAALRCNPVTLVNSSNILPFSSFDACKYRPRIACTYSLMLRRVTSTSFGNTNFDATIPELRHN